MSMWVLISLGHEVNLTLLILGSQEENRWETLVSLVHGPNLNHSLTYCKCWFKLAALYS